MRPLLIHLSIRLCLQYRAAITSTHIVMVVFRVSTCSRVSSMPNRVVTAYMQRKARVLHYRSSLQAFVIDFIVSLMPEYVEFAINYTTLHMHIAKTQET